MQKYQDKKEIYLPVKNENMKTAYVGYQVQEKYNVGATTDEDAFLLRFLKEKGLDIEPVIWNDSEMSWSDYELIILKSPWDYHENIDAFYKWLNHIKSLGIKMLNPAEIIQWNSDKHYLKDISNANLPVIPTRFLEQKSEFSENVFDELSANKIVVKPCISAGAKNTMIVEKENYKEKSALINELLLTESYLAQPFLEEIKNGEWSFIFLGNELSHAVLKKPKENDFRVQHYHGGTIHYPEISEEVVRQAKKYADAFAKNTLYARVDGILKNNTFLLMELELIEPYLFLNNEINRLENYYKALQKWM